MAIVTMFRVPGDPDELLQRKQEVVDPLLQEHAPKNGGIEHITAKTEDGLLIINVSESEEGSNAIADQVRPRAEEAGLPAPVDHQVFELVDRVQFG